MVPKKPSLPLFSLSRHYSASLKGFFGQGSPYAPHTHATSHFLQASSARRHIGKVHNALPRSEEHLQRGMTSRKPYEELPGPLHDPGRKIDKGEPYRLHPSCSPRVLQNKVFHGGIEVEREHHDPPPGSIHPKKGRRQLPSGKVFFHDGMRFFGFAAPLMVPMDKFLSFPVHVCDDPEQLIPGLIERDGLKGKMLHAGEERLFQPFPYGYVAVGLPLLCGTLGIGNKAHLCPLSGDVSLFIMDGMPLVCPTDRLLELFCDIRSYSEFDPTEAFMQLPVLAPVALRHKVMLVPCGIGAQTHRLHSGRKQRKGVEEDAKLSVAGRDIAVPELCMENESLFCPIRV